MKRKPKVTTALTPLRRRAETQLKIQSEKVHASIDEGKSHANTRRLVHELQVHRAELEMQNEEFQQTRNQLETGLEKYSDLYDFAPVGYVTLDHEGTILEANLTAASLLGLSRDQIVQRRFGLYVAPDDLPVFNGFLENLFQKRVRQFCEVTLLNAGGQELEARIEAVMAASGLECRAAIQDITVHKQTEEALLVRKKLESTGILAGGIAHDFNNLLTGILLNLELAQSLPPKDPELPLRLKDAKQTVLIARALTQQLLTFAEGGRPIRESARLSGVIQESVRLALFGSNLRCEFSLVDDHWLVEVDAGQIGQVIRNLVLNAREAMPSGGVISVRMENVILESSQNPSLPSGKYVRVSTADQGGGMAKDVLPKIFDPYFSTKERGGQKGMGLGLTICHAIVLKHGGAITVNSKLGAGTTIHFFLPTFEPALSTRKSARPNHSSPAHGNRASTPTAAP